jgi:hypothetical protein
LNCIKFKKLEGRKAAALTSQAFGAVKVCFESKTSHKGDRLESGDLQMLIKSERELSRAERELTGEVVRQMTENLRVTVADFDEKSTNREEWINEVVELIKDGADVGKVKGLLPCVVRFAPESINDVIRAIKDRPGGEVQVEELLNKPYRFAGSSNSLVHYALSLSTDIANAVVDVLERDFPNVLKSNLNMAGSCHRFDRVVPETPLDALASNERIDAGDKASLRTRLQAVRDGTSPARGND